MAHSKLVTEILTLIANSPVTDEDVLAIRKIGADMLLESECELLISASLIDMERIERESLNDCLENPEDYLEDDVAQMEQDHDGYYSQFEEEAPVMCHGCGFPAQECDCEAIELNDKYSSSL